MKAGRGKATLLIAFLPLVFSPLANAQSRPPTMPAQQFAAAPKDAVELIRQEYKGYFTELPDSRKCGPEDAKGFWKEYAIYESSGQTLMQEQKNNGPKYLVFGAQYNQLSWTRSKNPFNAAGATHYTNRSKTQYIMTSAGMLYVYEGGQLQHSLVCSITTAKTAKYEPGMLMLALPVEKDKSLTISLYAPVK